MSAGHVGGPLLLALKFSLLLAAAAESGASATGAVRRDVVATTPLLKVVQMLNGMLTKGKEEKHAEQVQYAAYKQFCDSTKSEKTRTIQEAKDQIEMLTADIQVAETEAMELGQKIAELDRDVATFEADMKNASVVREKERSDYTKVHKDYSDSIDAIVKAVQIVRAQNLARPQASSLVQWLLVAGAAAGAPQASARKLIDAFLAKSQDPVVTAMDAGPPEVPAYEFQSQSIIDMLEKLRDKFVDERTQLEKEELNKRHAHELFLQDTEAQVSESKTVKNSKVQQKAKQLQAAASMKADLQDATTTEAEDSTYLRDITAACDQKAADFMERQKLRTDEISALEQAIGILSSDRVAGVPLYSAAALAQRGATGLASFVQVRSEGDHQRRLRAATYLSDRADAVRSHMLSALALRVREDPFSKVKKLIQELITRLMEAANEEAQHKNWCDAELAENERARTARTAQVESLTSEIDQKKSEVLKLSSDITQLTQDIAATEEQVATETKLREEDKKTNEATVKDAQEAQTAVGQAITLLREFYDQAATATALVQGGQAASERSSVAAIVGVHRQDPPPIFEGSYQGMASGGVISMLEVIQSDYARLESTTDAMEVSAARTYEAAMREAAIAKATMKKDVEHKTHRKQSTEQSLVNLQNDLTSAETELTAANNYYDKLKPSCLDAGMNFSEREQRRQEEIQSLQEALRILNGEDIAVSA